MKKNNSIFLLLYAQALGGKSGNFFNCEAFAYPPALSNIGNIRFGTKSEILKPILAHQMFTTDTYSCHPQFINFDAAAIVKSLKLPGSVQIFSDCKTHFWSYLQYISPSNHEEADTRIFLHCLHASTQSSKHILVYTVVSDVVVLNVHFFAKLHLDTLWLRVGVFIISLLQYTKLPDHKHCNRRITVFSCLHML